MDRLTIHRTGLFKAGAKERMNSATLHAQIHSPSSRFRITLVLSLLLSLNVIPSSAQVVDVTMQLDTNSVAVGATTTLRVFAQVVPQERAGANRIFSWYVDVLNNNGAAASADYDAMLRSASDNEPEPVSSGGIDSGNNRISIHDTFLSDIEIIPGPGVDTPVELMAIPVMGVAPGTAQFSVRAGTGIPELAADFLVAPSGGGEPLIGGNYSGAAIDLVVTDAVVCDDIQLSISRIGTGGPGEELNLTFMPCPGFDHTVESKPNLIAGAAWTPLPGAPHNSGSVTVTNSISKRFFRVSTIPTP